MTEKKNFVKIIRFVALFRQPIRTLTFQRAKIIVLIVIQKAPSCGKIIPRL